MKKFIILSACLGWVWIAYSQESGVTLKQCFDLAVQNHPLQGQNKLYSDVYNLQVRNLDIVNLPQLNLNGQLTYQSDVTELPVQIPGMSVTGVPKEQYKVSLDANQVIYGGGITRDQKVIEKHNLEINEGNTVAELYRSKERISQVYFGILLADYSAQVYSLIMEELNNRLGKTEAGIRSGVVLPHNASILRAEILKTSQKLMETRSSRSALIAIMKVLTGHPFDDSSVFLEPDIPSAIPAYLNQRPEYTLFSLQLEKLEAMKQLSASKRNPRVMAFGNLGYGRPGLNMLKEEADLFYMVGARLSWNVWNWNQTRNEKQVLDMNKKIIENQQKAFDLSTRTQVEQCLADIHKAEELLNTDDSIIALRESITATMSSQLENGVITTTEYLTELNAEMQARQAKNMHLIQLLQAKTSYLAAIGKL